MSGPTDRRGGLLFQMTGADPAKWVEAFRAALPGRPILTIADRESPHWTRVTDAVVWRPPEGLLGSLPALERVISTGAGLDHLASDPSCPPHVRIIRRDDPVAIRIMAEYVLAQVLAHHRSLGVYAEAQRARHWKGHLVGPLAERRVTVLGFGPMGAASATLLAQLDAPVTAWTRRPREIAPEGVRLLFGPDGLLAAVAQADTLVVLLPSTPDTRGLVSGDLIERLPQGATLISCGRGDVVDTAAVLAALDSGRVGWATLDVLPQEPPTETDPLWSHPRVTLTPHVASLPRPADLARWVAGLLA